MAYDTGNESAVISLPDGNGMDESGHHLTGK